MTRNSSERGSSFFLILIGIALFAALSYAVMQSSRVSQSELSGDQARLAAQDIIQNGDAVAKAVQTLRLRGCADDEISSEGHPDGAINTESPSDESCHIFSLSGGKVNAKAADPSYYLTENPWSGKWLITGDDDFIGIGTNGCSDWTCAELLLTLSDLKPDVCLAIEKIVTGNTIMATDDDVQKWNIFTGLNYNSSPNVVGDDGSVSPLTGRGSGCIHETNENTYVFYQVLIAR